MRSDVRRTRRGADGAPSAFVSWLLTLLLVAGLVSGVSAPASAVDPNHQPIPATGDITLQGCEGTTSSPNGTINTPQRVVLTGRAAADLRDGKTVFLYDNKGFVIVTADGEYNGIGPRLPFCGARVTDDGTVSVAWRFCTDQDKGGCADDPPSIIESNQKLNDEQVQAIANLLASPDVGTKRARTLLQTQVWCVSENYTPGQLNQTAKTYFNNYTFGGGASPENAKITDAEVVCEPWGVIPDAPTLDVTGPTQPVDLDDDAVFSIEANFSGEVRLYVTDNQPIRLCPASQPDVTLSGGVLTFEVPGTATVCVTAQSPGGMSLTARGDDIPTAEGLTYLWSGYSGCQVFADYARGPLVDVVARAGATVLGIPGFELRKVADPVDGTDVYPGDTITYTVTGANTGQTVLDPVVIEDDLSGLWDYVSYNDDAFATVDGTEPAGELTLNEETLSWTGALDIGESVTITYSVTVSANATGQELQNRVTGSGTPPGLPPIVPPPVDTEHPVPTPGFDIDKTATPPAGTQVHPGETIGYRVTATNTGATVLDPVVIEDDLSGLWDYVSYNDDAFATINGTDPAGVLAPLDAQTLSWTGALQPGEAVTITYSVTVNSNATGQVLENRVTGAGTPPGLPPITPPPVDTEHPVPAPGFLLDKAADPVSGTEVNPGEDIVFTVTGSNTGATILDPVVIEDDLSGLWDYVSYNDDAFATINGTDPTGSLLLDRDAKSFSWTGALNPGETVTIMYSVTVNRGAVGQLLENRVTGEATPPGQPPITPPPVDTEHPVPTPGFELGKTADPVSGTEVNPGETIVFTLSGTNTGGTILDPVVIQDDLSGLWDYVSYNDDIVATIDGEDPAGALTLDRDEQTLLWLGVLNPGETVTITYSVTVAEDAVGQLLENRLTGAGTPPGLPPITPPPVDTEHPVPTPGFELGKTADPVSGTEVNPGETIVFTLSGTNTGGTILDPVVIDDDLSGLWDHVTYNDDAVATIDGEDPAGILTLDPEEQTLSWLGVLNPGETVTITYSVTVAEDAVGQLLENRVTGEATPPGQPPITPPPVDTEHPVPTPGFELGKIADPASGTEVNPGDTVTFTVTGSNTGGTILDPVVIDDDLSGLWDHVTYNDDAVATIDGEDSAGILTLDPEAQTLSWLGVLNPGETVTITYSVTVAVDASGQLLENRVTASGTPPGVPPITPPPVDTEHPVPTPGFELDKTADPASGTTVRSGDRLTFTITGTNTGGTVLDPVVIEDDLSGLWEYVTFNDDAVATIDSSPAGQLVVDTTAKSLVWTGALDPGEAVTITYSVTVKDTAGGQLLKNAVVGSATPPGVPPIVPPGVQTQHPVPPAGGLAASGMATGGGLAAAALLLLVLGVVATRHGSRGQSA